MKDNATIWISGTMHNIFSVGQILTELGFKILNVIIWQKTNPPPNFSCRYFTHSAEQIIWARKSEKMPHYFNYELMKQLNAWILDPFTGSSTTGIAGNLSNRRFLGIDKEEEFLEISKNRKLEIENPRTAEIYRQKLGGFNHKKELELFLMSEPQTEYKTELKLDRQKWAIS